MFNLLQQNKVDQMTEDNYRRIPLHYAFRSGNMYIANKLLEGMPSIKKVEVLNTQDKDSISVFGMLFDKLSMNVIHKNSLILNLFNIMELNILMLNPFVRFHKI